MRGWVTLGVVLAIGCAEPGAPSEAGAGTETIVEPFGMEATYGGAELCVEDTCGEIGRLEVLRVRPAIVGTRLRVRVTRGGAAFEREVPFDLDVAALGLDPETVVTERVSVGLSRDADGSCVVYRTNHVMDGHVATAPPSSDLETPCGPFADGG